MTRGWRPSTLSSGPASDNLRTQVLLQAPGSVPVQLGGLLGQRPSCSTLSKPGAQLSGRYWVPRPGRTPGLDRTSLLNNDSKGTKGTRVLHFI